MLDELLGRAPLRERIEDLEDELDALREERDRLESRLEAESERRREAVRERQVAEERVNRLEDRVAGLEGTLDRAGSDGASGPRTVRRLRPAAAAELFERLGTLRTGREGAFTGFVREEVPDAVEDALGDGAAALGERLPAVVAVEDRGVVRVALEVPCPPDPFARWDDRFSLESEWVEPTGRFALAVVRSDLFAVGEHDGGTRESWEGFESDVPGQHSKGGFSQARFERRREEAVEGHLAECRDALEAVEADRLYLTGAADVLERLDAPADRTRPVDATGAPEEALEDAFDAFFTTTCYVV